MRISNKSANTIKDALYGSLDSSVKALQLYDAVNNEGDPYYIGIGAAGLANSIGSSLG